MRATGGAVSISDAIDLATVAIHFGGLRLADDLDVGQTEQLLLQHCIRLQGVVEL